MKQRRAPSLLGPLAAVLLALPLLAAAGDAPVFKYPVVREAFTQYEQAKRGYELALKRGINLAKREHDAEQAALMEAELGRFTDGVDGRDVGLRDLMAGYEWTRIVSDGNNMQMTFHGNGSLTMHGRSAWNTWKAEGKRIVIGDTAFRSETVTVLYGVDSLGNRIIIVPTEPKPSRQ